MRRGIKGAAFAAALGALATTGHVGTASALQIAECIDPIEGSPSSPSQGCNAAVVAVSSILRAEVDAPDGSPMASFWPEGILSIDVDVIERNSTERFLRALYDGHAAQRVSLSMDLPPHVPIGSYSAASLTRPSDVQIQRSCNVLKDLLPDLPVLPCNSVFSSSSFDLSLGELAVHPPLIARRDGTLGAKAFEPLAVDLYSPVSSTEDVEREEAAVRERTAAAIKAHLGPGSSLQHDDPSAPAPESGLMWRYGAGQLGKAARRVGSSRILTASVSLDTPPRTASPAFATDDDLASTYAQAARSDARFPSGLAELLGLRRSVGSSGMQTPPLAAGTLASVHEFIAGDLSSAARSALGVANANSMNPDDAAAAVRQQLALASAAGAYHHFGGMHLSILPQFADPSPVLEGNSTQKLKLIAVFLAYTETGVVRGREGATALVRAFGRSRPSAPSNTGNETEVAAPVVPAAPSSLLVWKAFKGQLLDSSAAPALLPAPHSSTANSGAQSFPTLTAQLPWQASVSRSLQHTGLHRDLTYSLHLQTDIDIGVNGNADDTARKIAQAVADAIEGPSSAGGSAGGATSFLPRCRVALVQRLEATTYLDLDEVRDSIRRSDPLVASAGAAAPANGNNNAADETAFEATLKDLRKKVEDAASKAAVAAANVATTAAGNAAIAGDAANSTPADRVSQQHKIAPERSLSLRGFSRYIDVERPTSASTQHIIVLAVPIREQAKAQSPRIDPSKSQAVVTAEIVRRTSSNNEHGAVTSATTVRVHVRANFTAIFHARYQSVGCAASSLAGTEALSSAVGKPSWAATMSAVYGSPMDGDASVFLPRLNDLKRVAKGLPAGGDDDEGDESGNGKAAAPTAHERLWGKITGLLGGSNKRAPLPAPTAAEIAHAQETLERIEKFGLQWPYVGGCYALAHLSVPAVHLQCDDDTPALGSFTALGSDRGELTSLIAASLAPQEEDGSNSFSWTQIPLVSLTSVTSEGSSALPHHQGFSAAKMPVLAPVPVGHREHSSWVSPLTAAASLGCAFLLVVAAARQDRTGGQTLELVEAESPAAQEEEEDAGEEATANEKVEEAAVEDKEEEDEKPQPKPRKAAAAPKSAKKAPGSEREADKPFVSPARPVAAASALKKARANSVKRAKAE